MAGRVKKQVRHHVYVDLSVSPDPTAPKKRKRKRTPSSAQMSHASGPKGRKKAREGEKKMARGKDEVDG